MGVNKIKKYRKELGLTQKDMAETFKISTPAYCAKERGRVPFNSREMLVFKILVNTIDPEATIDDIFFSE